jgi:hypothetical protein
MCGLGESKRKAIRLNQNVITQSPEEIETKVVKANLSKLRISNEKYFP